MIFPLSHPIQRARFDAMVTIIAQGVPSLIPFSLEIVDEWVSKNWPARTIATELGSRGVTLRDLARKSGIRERDLNAACTREHLAHGITSAHHVIAAALGETVERVFPETVAVKRPRVPRQSNRRAA